MTKSLHKLAITIALGASLTMSATVNAADTGPTLYGVKRFCQDGCSSGVYTISTAKGSQPEIYWADGDLMGNGGAVYDGEKLYVLSYLDFWGMLAWSYLVCDIENKTYEFSFPENMQASDAAGTLTYDPSTSTAYAVCLDIEAGTGYALSVMDLADGRKTKVASLSQRLFALATDAQGTMYGIGADGYLYTVDKTTAKLTEIGPTGVIPENDQSAVIDYETGVMYWSAYTADGGALYTVDTKTAETTLLTVYNPSYQFTGLLLRQLAHPSNGPEAATDLSFSFEGAALSGTASFRMPGNDLSGNPIQPSAEIVWNISAGAEKIASGSAHAGELVTTPVTVKADGMTRFVVNLSIDGAEGRAANCALWVGMDTPKAVTDCEVTATGNEVTVSWTLPERGVNGGFVDHSKVRYAIDRGPEDTKIVNDHEGCSFTETVERPTIYPVLYRITPYIGKLSGEAVITPHTLVGEAYTPPFSIDLTDPFTQLVFNIVDANDDDMTWCYDFNTQVARCDWALEPESDDWLITQPIELEAGKAYDLNITVRSEGKYNYDTQRYDDVYAGTLTAYISEESTPESMTRALGDPYSLTSMEWHKMPFSEPVTVENTGRYHIGLHHTGERSIYFTFVNCFGMAPASSTEQTVAGLTGKLSATAANGLLTISNPTEAVVNVVTLEGRLVHTSSAGESSLNLPTGIYIVSDGVTTLKVAVK